MGEKQDLQSYTGYYLSETLILATINRKNDDRLFIELTVQYKKNTSSVHVVYNKLFMFRH